MDIFCPLVSILLMTAPAPHTLPALLLAHTLTLTPDAGCFITAKQGLESLKSLRWHKLAKKFAKNFCITTRDDVTRWHTMRVCVDGALRELWICWFFLVGALLGTTMITNSCLVFFIHEYDDFLTGGVVYAMAFNAFVCGVALLLLQSFRRLLIDCDRLVRPLKKVFADAHLNLNASAGLIGHETIEAVKWELDYWAAHPSPFHFGGPVYLTPLTIKAVTSLCVVPLFSALVPLFSALCATYPRGFMHDCDHKETVRPVLLQLRRSAIIYCCSCSECA